MAIAQNPLIGRTKKSFSENTFYTLNGQNIVRSKAVSVSNPKSPAQRAQRARFEGFTRCANSLSDEELNIIFAQKMPRQNRRSTLQQQLSVAFGAEYDPEAPAQKDYVATFNADLLDQIGTGEIGFEGDLVKVQMTDGILSFTSENCQELAAGIRAESNEDNVYIVAISEDGCAMEVASMGVTVSELSEIEENSIRIRRFAGHGDNAYCYVFGDKLQLIGLGTFSVAKRPARKGHNPYHSKGVTPTT